MVGLEGSGNISTFKPLSRLYSVIPSTEVTFLTPLGKSCAIDGATMSDVKTNPNNVPRPGALFDIGFMTIVMLKQFRFTIHENNVDNFSKQLLRYKRQNKNPFSCKKQKSRYFHLKRNILAVLTSIEINM
jgi:hypothetical protein